MRFLEAGEQFSLDNYQVVRREFFAHLSEPAVTFYNCKFYVNAACLHRFPGVDYVPGSSQSGKESSRTFAM